MAFAQGILCLYNVNGDHSSVMKQRKGDGEGRVMGGGVSARGGGEAYIEFTQGILCLYDIRSRDTTFDWRI